MLLSVLLVALGGLMLDYPRKFINIQTKSFSDDLIQKSRLYDYLRKFFKESLSLWLMKNVLIPLSFVVGLLFIVCGVYLAIKTIKKVGF